MVTFHWRVLRCGPTMRAVEVLRVCGGIKLNIYQTLLFGGSRNPSLPCSTSLKKKNIVECYKARSKQLRNNLKTTPTTFVFSSMTYLLYDVHNAHQRQSIFIKLVQIDNPHMGLLFLFLHFCRFSRIHVLKIKKITN